MKVKVKRGAPARRHGSFVGISLAVSIVVGVALLAYTVQSREIQASEPTIGNTDERMVPVPVRAIAQGEELSGVEFVYVKWDASTAHSFISDVAPYRSHHTNAKLPAYTPITLSSLESGEANDANEVINRIPEGMRAITVKVDSESAVEGWAQSGSFVDVIVMRRLSDNDNAIETKVIAENVKILSAGRSTKATPDNPRPPATVTLLVNQGDALRIKTATHLGRITFSLRGMGDESPTQLTHMNQRALLGSAKTILPREKRFRGTATGPNGDTWILTDGQRWHRQELSSLEDEL